MGSPGQMCNLVGFKGCPIPPTPGASLLERDCRAVSGRRGHPDSVGPSARGACQVGRYVEEVSGHGKNTTIRARPWASNQGNGEAVRFECVEGLEEHRGVSIAPANVE